jgi:phage tail-like protein
MKNVNSGRFHLLLGQADWGRSLDGDETGALALASWWSHAGSPSAPASLPSWDAQRQELTLQPRAIELPATAGETPLTLEARRGAAADRHGNVYRIADDRRTLRVTSVGSGVESAFWPAEPSGCEPQRAQERLVFERHAPPDVVQIETYLALAVTHDDYLVVAFAREDVRSLLSFDLIAGGQPLETIWPAAIAFSPFDMCARDGGGVWVLDRGQRRLWELDCTLAVVASGQAALQLAPETEDDFQPLSGPPRIHAAEGFSGGLDLGGSPGWVSDAIAVEAGVNGSVWVLDRDEMNQRSRVLRLRRDGDVWLHEASAWLTSLPALAHDFVHAAAPRWPSAEAASDKQLFISTVVGNQVHAFDVVDEDGHFELQPVTELYPLRRCAGRALIALRGDGCYDSGLEQPLWTRFVQQPRTRFETSGDLVTPVFDSGDLGTTWDKLLIDAAIPAGTEVEVWSRASDERDGFAEALSSPAIDAAQLVGGWNSEPALLLRPNGPELPWLRREAMRATRREAGAGTWELLLQNAQGRFVQLKLRLRSHNGTGTPRLRALRVWSPRFSYSQRFLPAVYREEETGGNFLERWLANFESTLTEVEDKVVHVQQLFDARTVPAEALGWLAEWFDLALDPAWDERRHRLFVRHAMDFFRWRGTVHGLRLALELAFDPCFDAAMFEGPREQDNGPRRIRIVESYQTRLIGALAAGDPGAATDGLRVVRAQPHWTPAEGNGGLAERYAAWLGRSATTTEQLTPFSLVPPAEAAAGAQWVAFFEATLGFVPSAGAQERLRWQGILWARYGGVEPLNRAHGTAYDSIDKVALPDGQPLTEAAAKDWQAFCERSDGAWTRARWQDFLARRYRRIEKLRLAHGASWPGFDAVALPDRLPINAAAQTDWLQFEGQLLAMHRTAHRFSVLLPVVSITADAYELEERLGLARRIVELEKPAHTVFDVRFFWAFNRVGEARLGMDTQIGAGSRAPELIPDAVVGRAYLGASFVAGASRPGAGDRRLLAC